MTRRIDQAFALAADPRVAATAAGAATAAALLRPLAPPTDLLLVVALACTVALALSRRGLWALTFIPFALLLADRPGAPAGATTLSSGGATESYLVTPAGGPPRLHHMGFWLEDLRWDDQAGAGSMKLRQPAAQAPVEIQLAAGRPSAVGPFAVTPVAAGRSTSPATVTLDWSLRDGAEEGAATVPIGGAVELPGGKKLQVTESRPSFNRQGPAVHVDDGAGDARWLFQRYPDHDAEARSGGVAVRWTRSTPASVLRLDVRPARRSVRAWLAEHPPPPVALIALLLTGLLALRGRTRSVAAALLVAGAIWVLPGRTAPSLGGEYSAPPYSQGEPVSLDLRVGPVGTRDAAAGAGTADVKVPVMLRLPVGGAGLVLGLAALLLVAALGGLALGGAGVTHGRSALRAAGLLLAAFALFLAVRPWLGPVPEVDRARVEAALRVHAPAPPGRAIVDWAPSRPGPYAPGPAAPDVALLGMAAAAGVFGARRR